jgi:hypothetical protein
MRIILDEGKPVWGHMLDNNEKRHDIGNLRTYAMAFVDMCLHDPEIGSSLKSDLESLLRR